MDEETPLDRMIEAFRKLTEQHEKRSTASNVDAAAIIDAALLSRDPGPPLNLAAGALEPLPGVPVALCFYRFHARVGPISLEDVS